MSAGKKIIRILFIVWGCIAFYMAGNSLYKIFTIPYPEGEVHQVWVPPNTEIRSDKEVEPGTFKIIIPLEEFKSLLPEKESVLLVYNTDSYPFDIQYWWPQRNGIFKYSSYVLPYFSGNTTYFKWNAVFHKEKGLIEYIPSGKYYVPFLLMGILLVAIGIFCCNWRALCWAYRHLS